jgi:hypothetical protein
VIKVKLLSLLLRERLSSGAAEENLNTDFNHECFLEKANEG